jgi:hypothetical protein
MQYVIKKRMELAKSLLILTETTPTKFRETGIQNIAYRRNTGFP